MEEDRRSDTEETYGQEGPPGGASDQNAEAQPDEGGGAEGSGGSSGEEQRESTDDPGSAKESGQSTGHPEHAG